MAREKFIAGKDIVVHGSIVPAEAYPITIFAPTVRAAKEMMLPLTESGVTVAFHRSRRTRAEWEWYEHDPDIETVRVEYSGERIGYLIKTVREIRRVTVRNRLNTDIFS